MTIKRKCEHDTRRWFLVTEAGAVPCAAPEYRYVALLLDSHPEAKRNEQRCKLVNPPPKAPVDAMEELEVEFRDGKRLKLRAIEIAAPTELVDE